MNKKDLKKIVRQQIIKEVMGFSAKEKYISYIDKLCKLAEEEINKYPYGRLFGESGRDASNEVMAAIIKYRLVDIRDSMPNMYKIIPQLFSFKKGTSGASGAVYVIGGKEVNGIVPSQCHNGLDGGILKADKMKEFFQKILEYKKKELLDSRVLNNKEEMKKNIESLKGE